MQIDRRKFFDHARETVFRGQLTQEQVDGCLALLNEAERRNVTDLRHIAYILATTYHETAHTMQPIREYGRGRGRRYGIPDKTTGHVYYGRGYVQLTWASNYKKMGAILNIPLYENPDLALSHNVAAQIIFEGMLKAESFRGDFTGRSLEDYFNDRVTDWRNARKIVNGLDKAGLIGEYGKHFYRALLHATGYWNK